MATSNPSPAGEPLPLRKLVIVVAIAIGVGALGSYVFQQPAAVAALRGRTTAPTLVAPQDETATARDVVFQWKASTANSRLVVIDLSQSDKVVIDRVLQGEKYEPQGEERPAFVAGHQYHWYVEAQSDSGPPRPSPAGTFSVR